MRKKIWVLAVMCCLSTITMAIIAARADSPPPEPGVLRAKGFLLVNEKGETVASIEPLAQGLPGFGIAFGKNAQIATMSFMCAPDGSVSISSLDGRSKSTATLLLGSDGSNSLNLGQYNAEMSASFGVGSSGPYMRFKNKDNTSLEADTENGVRLGGTKKLNKKK